MSLDFRNTLQEQGYVTGFDYRAGSPHLQHWSLFTRIRDLICDEARRLNLDSSTGLLEIGAGHGGMTESLLAAGIRVTATEMSQPSCDYLEDRYGANPNFTAVYDPTGALEALGDRTFGMVLLSSVIHHIPDYLAAIGSILDERMEPGGSLVSVQDPLRYDTLPKGVRTFDKLSYSCWRLGQGNLGRGIKTVSRRVRGKLDESNPADMVEYHVIRNGCDSEAIKDLLTPHFESVEVLPYWSNQFAAGQWLGTRLSMANTFAIVARGFTPDRT